MSTSSREVRDRRVRRARRSACARKRSALPGPVERREEAGARERERVRRAVGRLDDDRDPAGRHGAEEREQVARPRAGHVGVDDEHRPARRERAATAAPCPLPAGSSTTSAPCSAPRARSASASVTRIVARRGGGEHVPEHRVARVGRANLVVGAERGAALPFAPRKGTTTLAMPWRLSQRAGVLAIRTTPRSPPARGQFAALLELAGANPYTVRAYRRAADLIRDTPAPVAELVRTGRVRELRGIGPGIEARLRELVETGEIAELKELEREVSPELVGARPLPRRLAKQADARDRARRSASARSTSCARRRAAGRLRRCRASGRRPRRSCAPRSRASRRAAPPRARSC